MTTQPTLTIHPSWRAKVIADGELTIAAKVRLTAKTGLSDLAAIEDLAKVKAFMYAEVDTAIGRLTVDREPKAWPALRKEDRLVHGRQDARS